MMNTVPATQTSEASEIADEIKELARRWCITRREATELVLGELARYVG